jgi:hypothetical protein
VWTRLRVFFAKGWHNGEIAMIIKATGRWALIVGAGVWLCFAGPMRATDGDARPLDVTPAAADGDNAEDAPVVTPHKSNRHHWKRHASHSLHHKSSVVASKSSKARKTEEADAVADDVTSPVLPASVANANAQLSNADAAADEAVKTVKTISVQAENVADSPRQSDATPARAETPTASMMAGSTLAALVANTTAAGTPATNVEPAAAEQPVETDRSQSVDRSRIEDKAASGDAAAPAADATMVAQVQQPAATQAANDDDAALDKTSLIGKLFIAFGGLLTLASAARMFMV